MGKCWCCTPGGLSECPKCGKELSKPEQDGKTCWDCGHTWGNEQ